MCLNHRLALLLSLRRQKCILPLLFSVDECAQRSNAVKDMHLRRTVHLLALNSNKVKQVDRWDDGPSARQMRRR